MRKHNGTHHDESQWGNDALSFGTIIVLGLMFLAPLAKDFLPLPANAITAFDETTKANAILVMTALANCIRTVWSGTVKGLKKAAAAQSS